jgi:L-ascorbate metabolism protein UlaG (beta-lactamase superfamily)
MSRIVASSKKHARARATALLPWWLAVVLLTIGTAGCCAFSSLRYSGPLTGHYDGERFVNQAPTKMRSIGEFAAWAATRERGEWADWIEAPAGPAPEKRVEGGRLRVTLVGHATLLVQVDGLNILTDPVWSMRVGPASWTGPKRRRPPGIRFEDLPPIDLVLVSHNHYDHMDIPTLRRLAERDRPRMIVGLGNAAVLEAEGIEGAVELDWWEVLPIDGRVQVTAVPAQHFSMRGLCDRDGTLWAGFVVESSAGPVYFAGDTGWGPHFEQIREVFGPVRLAMLPIGAFLPRWIMEAVHISPQEAVRAHRVLEAAVTVPMHYGTFQQADEGQLEPLVYLARALRQEPPPLGRFEVLGFGQAVDIR